MVEISVGITNQDEHGVYLLRVEVEDPIGTEGVEVFTKEGHGVVSFGDFADVKNVAGNVSKLKWLAKIGPGKVHYLEIKIPSAQNKKLISSRSGKLKFSYVVAGIADQNLSQYCEFAFVGLNC